MRKSLFIFVLFFCSILSLVHTDLLQANEIGTINLLGVTSANCNVYNTNGDFVSKHSVKYSFNLPVGAYTFSVNGTAKEVNVLAGKNEFPLGNITISGVTSANCNVYSSSDTSGDYLSKHNARYPFDLFPGNYTFSVNGTEKEVNVLTGKNEFPLGNITISGVTSANCTVYKSSDTSGDYLSKHNARYPFDLFPGVYTFSLNNTIKEVTIYAGENIFNTDLIRLNPVPQDFEISGCITYKTKPMENSSIMVIQSGQFHKKTNFDSNGCFSLKNVSDEIPFSIFIRHGKNK